MTDTFSCPACGAPNKPEAGRVQMICSYCGANLTIPTSLRRAAPPKVKKTPERIAPASSLEEEAPDLLRKAQPIAVKAWNTYASWTWIRRALPACFVILVIALCGCIILSASPFILNSIGR